MRSTILREDLALLIWNALWEASDGVTDGIHWEERENYGPLTQSVMNRVAEKVGKQLGIAVILNNPSRTVGQARLDAAAGKTATEPERLRHLEMLLSCVNSYLESPTHDHLDALNIAAKRAAPTRYGFFSRPSRDLFEVYAEITGDDPDDLGSEAKLAVSLAEWAINDMVNQMIPLMDALLDVHSRAKTYVTQTTQGNYNNLAEAWGVADKVLGALE